LASQSDDDSTTDATGRRIPVGQALLALLSLALAVLIWLSGLQASLERPSVVNALSLRQRQLDVLVAEALPPALATTLLGDDPRGALRDELERQLAADTTVPPAVSQRLELALLQPQPTAAAALRDLEPSLERIDPPRRPLLQALINGQPQAPDQLNRLLAPWRPSPLLAQLSCERLGGRPATCLAQVARPPLLLLRFLLVSVLPIPAVLVGVALLLRQLWLGRRQRLPAAPPLVGPPLEPIDLVLLIAGGFVVLGEVISPFLLMPLLQNLVQGLAVAPTTAQGLQVLGSYLGLTLPPLLILMAQLAGRRPQRPPGGWLQWRWRPLASALRAAAVQLLMVLPVVALAGWLQEQLVGDPGGSNPLLELVLTSGDRWALACFAVTATVLAPLFEELLFRGVLLPAAGRRLGGAWAVLISATVFAFAHLSVGECLPLLLLGLGLGWLRWRSGRLAPCVLLHALWNGLTFANLIALGL